jgi:hypothetical protein
MRTFLFAFLGGMLASIPAANMFAQFNASILDSGNSMSMLNRLDIAELLQLLAALFLIPPIGSAIGAKLGGQWAGVHYMVGRGTGGQLTTFIILTIAFMQFPEFEASILALSLNGQTIASLALMQIGCTLGTVWGV